VAVEDEKHPGHESKNHVDPAGLRAVSGNFLITGVLWTSWNLGNDPLSGLILEVDD